MIFELMPLPVFCMRFQLQHLAASCLQRNIRKLMGVSEWPWWRLYTKVKPLLDIHRTETELRDSQVTLYCIKFCYCSTRTFIIKNMLCDIYRKTSTEILL